MAATYIEELEEQDHLIHSTEDAAEAPTTYLQHVVDDWEEAAAGPQAESACTAAVREWEEKDR